MAGDNGKKIIEIGSGNQEPYRICHRSISATVIMAQAQSQAPGLIGGPPPIVPMKLATEAPCIGPRCRMWCLQSNECKDVLAVDRDAIAHSTRYQYFERLDHRLEQTDESLNEIRAALGSLEDVIAPPSGGRPPLQIELITIPETLKKGIIAKIADILKFKSSHERT